MIVERGQLWRRKRDGFVARILEVRSGLAFGSVTYQAKNGPARKKMHYFLSEFVPLNEFLDPEIEKAFRVVQDVLGGLDTGVIVSEPSISALAAEVSADLTALTDYLREHHIRITYREDAS